MTLKKCFRDISECPALIEDQDTTSRSRAQARKNFLEDMY